MPGHHDSHEDELVKVAYVNDSLEGQLIVGLLESEGIPCLQLVGRQSNQVARPAAWGERSSGPRRVMVPAGQAERALSLLERRRSEFDEQEAREV